MNEIKSNRQNGTPVAALVIEPMHSLNGNVVSENFINELGTLTRDTDVALIVDATESGCGATGKNFWGYAGRADYLVFGKRAFVEGFYSRPASKAAAITFGGDYLRLLQFQVVKDTIEKDRLIDKVNRVGGYLRQQTESVASRNNAIKSVGGEGTSIFINTQDGETAKELHKHLLRSGVITKLNNSEGVCLKPSLILEEKHVDVFTRALSSFK